MKNNKTLFTIMPHSFVDVITNSSSELFTSTLDKEELEKLIKDVYPNYLDEYEPLRNVDEISDGEFEMYLSYVYRDWDDKMVICTVFNIEPELIYSNLEERLTKKYWYPEYSSEGIKIIKEKVDPNKKLLFLFSIDDNPDWDMQENLMSFMTRYHLG